MLSISLSLNPNHWSQFLRVFLNNIQHPFLHIGDFCLLYLHSIWNVIATSGEEELGDCIPGESSQMGLPAQILLNDDPQIALPV